MNAKCQTNDTQSHENVSAEMILGPLPSYGHQTNDTQSYDDKRNIDPGELSFGSCTNEYYTRKKFEFFPFCTTMETLLMSKYAHLLTPDAVKEEPTHVSEPSKETEESNEEKTKLYCESCPAT